jgi:hypothetical protein
LRELKTAILAFEDASGALFVALSADWNSQPNDKRVWPNDKTTQPWQRFAHCQREVTALRSEVGDDALRAEIGAYQRETSEGLSDQDAAEFKARSLARAELTQRVIDSVGAAYRNLK